MPEKPIVTPKANSHYQARFDKLERMANEGDWDGVRNYEVKGINSYAKMVKQYRDRLLAAHAASEAAAETA
jgi:predicted RNA-binding protein with PUA-like domain